MCIEKGERTISGESQCPDRVISESEKKTKVLSTRITPTLSQEIDIWCRNMGSSRAKMVSSALHTFFSDPRRMKILIPMEVRLCEIEERLSDIEHRLEMSDGQK
jgi:hypothetical protein